MEIDKAIEYFRDAVRESDEIIADCSPALRAELVEQKKHFVVALAALEQQKDTAPKEPCGWCGRGYRFEFHWVDDEGATITTADHMVIGEIADYCPMCGRVLKGRENHAKPENSVGRQ